jgi:hypothetical protein
MPQCPIAGDATAEIELLTVENTSYIKLKPYVIQ